jgi:hypothetical protein
VLAFPQNRSVTLPNPHQDYRLYTNVQAGRVAPQCDARFMNRAAGNPRFYSATGFFAGSRA